MALTQEDLQAIQQLLQPLHDEQASMKAELKGDIAELQKGQQSIRGDISDLYKNHEKHMAIISEGLGHLNERYAQLDNVEQTVEDHDHRIHALEQKVANG